MAVEPAVARESPRSPRLSGPERQRSIVDAATEVFAARGYESARIEEIAARAGVSKSLIYEHFPGKRELYAQILDASTKEHLKRVVEATASAEGSVEVMERALGAYLDFVAEDPARWRLIEQEVTDPEIIAVDNQQQARGERAAAALLAADPDIARQNLREDQLELLGVMVNGATVRAANWWVDHPSMHRDEVLRYLMRFMWLGLERIRRGGFATGRARSAASGVVAPPSPGQH